MEIRRLIWDPWNIDHISRHGVTMKDVEDVCTGSHRVRISPHGRVILIGVGTEGRLVVVVLDVFANGDAYVITARPASRKERKWYQATGPEDGAAEEEA